MVPLGECRQVSKIPRISYIVEGATDYHIIDALVERFLQTDNYVPTQIQPPMSEYTDDLGPLGGGWRGVVKWCSDIGARPEGLAGSMILANTDCLVIHVDADMASEAEFSEIDLSAPCPPAKDTCDRVRQYLIMLLRGQLHPKVVLCVPAQCIEAWVFAALHPDLVSRYEPIECKRDVAALLVDKPDKLVRNKDGRSRKQPERYRNNASKVADKWPNATARCPEALRFDSECQLAIKEAKTTFS